MEAFQQNTFKDSVGLVCGIEDLTFTSGVLGLLNQLLTDPERYVRIPKILSTIADTAALKGPLAGSIKATLDSLASG